MATDDFSIPTPNYRVPRRSAGMDGDTRKLAVIAAGLAAALLAIIGGYSALHRPHGAVPVVQADGRPIRVKPDNPGGMEVAGAANEVFSGGSDTDGGKLAPPPETPAPQALRPAERATTATPPDNAAAAAPAPPQAVAPLPAKPAVAKVEPPKPAASAKPAVVASTAAPKPAPATAATAAAAPKAEKAGKAAVQLAAFPTEEAAKAEWQRLQKRLPDLFGSRQPAISRTERDGRTWWRLRTSGFADSLQAVQFCNTVRAKGASCSVADF